VQLRFCFGRLAQGGRLGTAGLPKPYCRFEYTSLRQLVFIVREVPSPNAQYIAFGRHSSHYRGGNL
jgi:hypothetical protein